MCYLLYLMFRCDRRCDGCDGKFGNFVGTKHTLRTKACEKLWKKVRIGVPAWRAILCIHVFSGFSRLSHACRFHQRSEISRQARPKRKGHRVASPVKKGCLKFRVPSGPPMSGHHGNSCSPKGLHWMVMYYAFVPPSSGTGRVVVTYGGRRAYTDSDRFHSIYRQVPR